MEKRTDDKGFIKYDDSSGLVCDHTCRMQAVENQRRIAANHALLTGMIGR